MIKLHQTSTISAFARKIFHSRNTRLLLLACPASVSLASLLDALMAETPVKALLLPLVVTAVSLSLYFVVFALDFISGVKASRHEAKDGSAYFSSAKGWSSMWKLATVSVLVTWSSFFSMLAAIGDFSFLASFFLFSSGTIAIMASLLDVYSIGENQKRLTGKKAGIFQWLEQVREAVSERFLGRIRRSRQ